MTLWRLTAAALALTPLAAQHHTSLSGIVRDPSDSAVPGASITAVQEETGFRRAAISGPAGGYLIDALQPGVYKLMVRKEGFRTLVRFGLKLDVAQPARFDFELQLGGSQETITVEGAQPAVNSADASVGTLVGRDRIARIPLNGRGLLSLLELAPGAVLTPATGGESGQFTVNGQRPNFHNFTVDGVSVNTGVSGGGLPAQTTGGALPGLSAFGSMHSLISLEALDEFRVQTATASTEFGRLPGAQVSLSSRSGSNEFHASLFEYFRRESLDANDWFANRHGDPRQPSRLNNFGGSLGGPIRRDRTFFFAAYEGLRLRQPFTWRSVVPSNAARQAAPAYAAAILALYPRPNGANFSPLLAEWTGQASLPARSDSVSIRLDHALGTRATLFARYNDAPSRADFAQTQVDRLEFGARSATLGSTIRFGTRGVTDFRLNYSRHHGESTWSQAGIAPDSCYLRPVTAALTFTDICESYFRFTIAGLGPAAIGRESSHRQQQWNLVANASVMLGGHQLRFGADYRRLEPVRIASGTTVSAIAESLQDLLATTNLFVAISPPAKYVSDLEEISLFGQDSWRLGKRLTLTYGVRWDFTPSPTTTQPLFGLESGTGRQFGNPAAVPIWQTRRTNFEPRAGFAYRLTQSGRTVVRGGLGLYLDSALSVAADLVNGGPFNVFQLGNPAASGTGLARIVLGYGFAPDLRLPAVWQASAAFEHSFADQDAVSLTYAGARGRALLRRELDGLDPTQRVRAVLTTNHGASEYHALQLQYRRRMANHVQALAGYSYAHSIDDGSSDSLVHFASAAYTAPRDRGSSDFDVRHSFHAAVSYELGRWALDAVVRARSGFPISVIRAEYTDGISFANVLRPALDSAQPPWIADAGAPGGRRLNAAAFPSTAALVQGGLGRNSLTGFGLAQTDLALRREFRLRDRQSLSLRVEAFNLFNHANLADPVRYLSSPLFGQSASMLSRQLGTGSPGTGLSPMFQIGGPRSVQVVLRWRF